MKREHLEDYVLTIPDFPQKGIMFRDITSLVQDPDGLQDAVDGLIRALEGVDFDVVLGLESRGFIFGTAIAYAMHKGFVPVRKKGKLPRETVSAKYDLEYGQAEIEIHKDAIKPGMRVAIVDDLLATGGTAAAVVKLVEEMGASVVAASFAIELCGLSGREKLDGIPVQAVMKY